MTASPEAAAAYAVPICRTAPKVISRRYGGFDDPNLVRFQRSPWRETSGEDRCRIYAFIGDVCIESDTCCVFLTFGGKRRGAFHVKLGQSGPVARDAIRMMEIQAAASAIIDAVRKRYDDRIEREKREAFEKSAEGIAAKALADFADLTAKRDRLLSELAEIDAAIARGPGGDK